MAAFIDQTHSWKRAIWKYLSTTTTTKNEFLSGLSNDRKYIYISSHQREEWLQMQATEEGAKGHTEVGGRKKRRAKALVTWDNGGM